MSKYTKRTNPKDWIPYSSELRLENLERSISNLEASIRILVERRKRLVIEYNTITRKKK